MNIRSTHANIRRLTAVVVAGTTFGLAGAYAMASNDRSAPTPADHNQSDRRAVADWASDNQLGGLSPTSLSAVTIDHATESRIAAEYQQVVDWARSEHLSGLSPASVSTAND